MISSLTKFTTTACRRIPSPVAVFQSIRGPLHVATVATTYAATQAVMDRPPVVRTLTKEDIRNHAVEMRAKAQRESLVSPAQVIDKELRKKIKKESDGVQTCPLGLKHRPIVILTGISGRIGMNQAKQLRDAGYNVIGISGRTKMDEREGHTFIQCDLSNKADVEKMLDEVQKLYGTREIASVIHSAGKYGFERTPDLEEYAKANIQTTELMLETLAEKGFRVGQFVLFSSQAVYASAPKGTFLTEDSALRTDYAYAWSKVGAEKRAIILGEANGIPVVIVRVPSVYDDHGTNDGIAKTVDLVTRKDPLARLYPGDQHQNGWSYMHMKDFTRAIQCIVDERARLAKENPHLIFHIGEEGCTSQYDIQQAVARALGREGFTSIEVPVLMGVLGAEFMDIMTGGEAPVHGWMVRALGRVAIDTERFSTHFPDFRIRHSLRRTIPKIVDSMIEDPMAFAAKHHLPSGERLAAAIKEEQEKYDHVGDPPRTGPKIEEIA